MSERRYIFRSARDNATRTYKCTVCLRAFPAPPSDPLKLDGKVVCEECYCTGTRRTHVPVKGVAR